MKLWHITQWGNLKEGANGKDTQCIIRANSMEEALKEARVQFFMYDWKDGDCDFIILMGEDNIESGKAELVIRPWHDTLLNMTGKRYPSWSYNIATKEWTPNED